MRATATTRDQKDERTAFQLPEDLTSTGVVEITDTLTPLLAEVTDDIAESMIETLALAGVERIYGLAGDSLNAITDSVRKNDDIKWVHVRHEDTAAFAAGAEAHLTGKLSVCAGSCGPGNLHLINGLYDCHRSRVPVLAIAAQIPSNEIGSTYFR